MIIGDFECYEIVEGYFKLDGGSMFGSIPKNLWQRVAPADQQNRIQMALRPLLILTADKKILIDTGIGHKFPEKFEKLYGIDHSQTDIHRALAKHKLTVADITDVIITHLHFDHTGGSSYHDEDGNLQLTFPNAHWWLHRDNVELSKHPNPKDRASYLADSIDPILQSGKLSIIEVGQEENFLPGVSAVMSYGHTTGMMCPLLRSQGESLLYCADLIPTAAHIPVPWVMGYDLYALTTMEEKIKILHKVLDDDTILFFEHDANVAACHLQKNDKGKYQAGAVVDMS